RHLACLCPAAEGLMDARHAQQRALQHVRAAFGKFWVSAFQDGQFCCLPIVGGAFALATLLPYLVSSACTAVAPAAARLDPLRRPFAVWGGLEIVVACLADAVALVVHTHLFRTIRRRLEAPRQVD